MSIPSTTTTATTAEAASATASATVATPSTRPLLSICIPSYNRVSEFKRLLESIDGDPKDLSIVICEDASPNRSKIREMVQAFAGHSRYRVAYHENPKNLGYDGNLRTLIEKADGEFVMFIGDDDAFLAGRLDQFMAYLRQHRDVAYVLRSYFTQDPQGKLEEVRYFTEDRVFSPGLETCAFLFKRTVSICGITFKRDISQALATDRFDGTLLYQVYLIAEIALKYPTVYCNTPAAIGMQTFQSDAPMFGASEAEKKFFKPGKVYAQNSINFTKGFFRISEYIDEKYQVDLTTLIRTDLSKYSYPFLSIQRKRGAGEFLKYARRLIKETRLNQTWHFWFYTMALLLLGEERCGKGIAAIKRIVGHTPHL